MSIISLRADAAYGQSGQYIARITGRDAKFTFARQFVGRKSDPRLTEAQIDDPGIYECCDIDRKARKDSRFYFVAQMGDELHKLATDREDAMAVAKAMDAGREFRDIIGLTYDDSGSVVYEILTAMQAAKKQAGQTIDSAIEACWAAMEALPEKDAKKVLAALKAKISPPKAKETPPKPVSEATTEPQPTEAATPTPPASETASETASE